MLRLVPHANLTAFLGEDVGAVLPTAPVIAQDFRDSYLESVRLLREASEIEHALMVQYLYAAFSVRPQFDGIVGPLFASADGLMGVAIQEMEHLGKVNRALVALGAEPNLRSQDFPYQTDLYPFPLNLERLTRQSLAKYVFTEAPAIVFEPGPDNPDPDFMNAVIADLNGLRPNHIGSIYRTIIGHLTSLQVTAPFQLPDLRPHIDNLNTVLEEGEHDHFPFFRTLYEATHPGFNHATDAWSRDPNAADYPSMPVPLNPSAIPGNPNPLPSGPILRLAWLANLHYWVVDILVDLGLRSGRPAYIGRAKRHMVGPLYELGANLAVRGGGAPFDPLSTGYAPGKDEISTRRFLRQLLRELAALEAAGATDLPADYPADVTAATIAAIEQLGI
jgi:rubrerythrin